MKNMKLKRNWLTVATLIGLLALATPGLASWGSGIGRTAGTTISTVCSQVNLPAQSAVGKVNGGTQRNGNTGYMMGSIMNGGHMGQVMHGYAMGSMMGGGYGYMGSMMYGHTRGSMTAADGYAPCYR